MNENIDVSNVVLNTKRLKLRFWKVSDLDDFYEYAKVDGVGEMAGWPHHENRQSTEYILREFINGKNCFAVEYDGKVIGSLGIEKYNEELFEEFSKLKGREIGYVLSKDYWGRGLMPEAVNAVLGYLFNVLGLDFVLCSHFDSNTQSQRVQEKCGFEHYKRVENITLGNGTHVDGAWFSLLKRDDFKKLQKFQLKF